MDIRLNFINCDKRCKQLGGRDFQKNTATGFDELAVARMVTRYCGQGVNHPFAFPKSMQVGASASYGNFALQLNAQTDFL